MVQEVAQNRLHTNVYQVSIFCAFLREEIDLIYFYLHI